MNRKMILKLIVDVVMTVSLFLLMAYEMIGQGAHEWIGIGMFLFFVLHHILNHNWSKNLFKGKYTAFRIVQTVIDVLVLLSMVGSMISGAILSRHALSFLPIKGGRAFARNLHMLSAYWGFVFMSLHLGLHWRMMMGMAGKYLNRHFGQQPGARRASLRKWSGRLTAVFIAGYGIYAFGKREIGGYMMLTSHFVFFDYEEPLVFFLLDYAAIMGLFVFLAYYVLEGLKQINGKQEKSRRS